MDWNERHWAVALGLAGVAAVGVPGKARACSPPPPEEVEPCESLWLYVPAPQFPVNLEGLIRIREVSWNRYGWAVLESEDWDVAVPFVVERQTDAGWEEVEYVLVDEPELVEGARAVQLVDPQPGAYRVVWPESTCAWEPEVETGAGRQIGTFTITPEVPWPASLGPVDAQWTVEDTELYVGEEGDCTPIIYEAVLGTVELSLPFDPEWMPWADSLGIAVYIDGEVERGFAAVTTEQAEAGVFTTAVSTVCTTDDEEVRELYSWGPATGTHAVELVARVDGYDNVFSDTVEYTVQCPAGDDPPGDDSPDEPGIPKKGGASDDGELDEPTGCRIGGTTPPSAWLCVLVLGLWRKRSTRQCPQGLNFPG